MKTSKTMAVVNFIYFLANFPGIFTNVIDSVFFDDPYLANHFKQKFNGIMKFKYYEISHIPPAAIIDFLFELSVSNMLQFVNWIETNYHFSHEHETGNF
ncbi:MAG: hypothetical protein WCI92_16025 [Bacteroidota bacterium]